MPKTSRDELRSLIRRQRKSLTAHQQQGLAADMTRHLTRHPLFMRSRRIAAYLAVGGEMDPAPVIEQALTMGKTIYLPVLEPYPGNRLWFVSYRPGEKLVTNRFGILEPAGAHHRRIAPYSLDLVLTPLVAFDARGHRLGMGGGYYDRSFAFQRRRQHWKKPRLLGVAYQFQQRDRIVAQAWDIPLLGIATESGVALARDQP